MTGETRETQENGTPAEAHPAKPPSASKAVFSRGGGTVYPLRWAFRDAYMACLLERAAQSGEEAIAREMAWDVDEHDGGSI